MALQFSVRATIINKTPAPATPLSTAPEAMLMTGNV